VTRGTRWFIAGVVLLLLLGAGVVALVTLDSDDGAEPEADRPATGSPSTSPTPSTGGEFGPVPDLCEQTEHFAPVFDIVPAAETPTDSELESGSLYQRDCIFRLDSGSSLGHLTVHAALYGSEPEAENGYRGTLEPAADQRETQQDLEGNWDEAALLLDESDTESTVQLLALDGVLLLNLVSGIVGDAHDAAAQQAALTQVADSVREAMRR
jgi:hypothetical protein